MNAPRQIELIVEEEQAGVRLDAFLAANIEEATRSFLQKLIESGAAAAGGRARPKSYKVRAGEQVLVHLPPPKAIQALAENIPLDIVYEDEDVVVVNKPRGMVVHPAPGSESGTLVNALLYHCGNLSGINGAIRPGIVHRIDKDTTGLLAAAKNTRAHIALALQFKEHSAARRYEALVHGQVKNDQGTIAAQLGRHPKNRLKMAVVQGGREAVTHYQVQARYERFTHIQARLETGRTHQIRVHMAYIHHPLAGDLLYGPQQKVLGADSQLLHAGLLGFLHPRTGEYMEFKAPLPELFAGVLTKLQARQRNQSI